MRWSVISLFAVVACQPTIPDGDPADRCVDTPTFTDIYAVELRASSESGQSLVGASARWKTDSTLWEGCTVVSSDSWLCGPDVTGPITVEAWAPGHEPQQLTPVVLEDECGDPATRQVELVLPGAPCPPGEVPAVEAVVYGPLVDSYVAWADLEGGGPWQRCELVGARPALFHCAMNYVGALEVGLFTEGVVTQSHVLDVPLGSDRCFPVTEVVVFELGRD